MHACTHGEIATLAQAHVAAERTTSTSSPDWTWRTDLTEAKCRGGSGKRRFRWCWCNTSLETVITSPTGLTVLTDASTLCWYLSSRRAVVQPHERHTRNAPQSR